jgi:DNA-binding MarR family transcriptional regulator
VAPLDEFGLSAYALTMADFNRAARQIARECPAVRIREASRMLTRVYDSALRPLSLQSSQLSILVAVAMSGENGAMIGALAQRLVMDRTTLTRNILPLEKAGLIRVSRLPEDARARVITLTRAGERMIEAAHPLWEKAQHRVREALGVARLEALRDQLSEVIEFAPSLSAGSA